jgi:hypothetical protein
VKDVKGSPASRQASPDSTRCSEAGRRPGAPVVVQKGEDKWEIAADSAQTKDLKAGDKVTIEYTMNAKKVTKK